MEVEHANFFLDAIPKEVMDNVVKFLGGLSSAKKWESYISLRYVVELLGVRGGFGRVLKTQFKTLCISSAPRCTREHDKYGWKLGSTGMA